MVVDYLRIVDAAARLLRDNRTRLAKYIAANLSQGLNQVRADESEELKAQ